MTDWTPTTEQVRDGYRYDPEEEYRNPGSNAHITNGYAFDRWLRQVETEAAVAGYEAARQDMLSGAFIGGPTYEALAGSFTGRKIAAEAWAEGALDSDPNLDSDTLNTYNPYK